MEKIRLYGNTHPGRRRAANQDAWITRQLWSDDKALAVVIDGVGGYAGGERAAAIAKESIDQYMQVPSGDTLTMLREAVIFANNRIAAERKNDQRFGEMCCVLTAVVADTVAQCIYFVHVGDTRLYRYRHGKLQKITKDHSFVGIREDAGEITEQEAMAHPHRNQILREVGSAPHRLDDEDFLDYGREDFIPGDVMLLCSDGLTDMITTQQAARVLLAKQPLNKTTQRLIDLANEAGGHDNITVALLQYPVTTAVKTIPPVLPAVKKTEPPAGKTNPVKTKKWKEASLLAAFLLLIGVAAAGWYLIKPKNIPLPAAGQLITNQPVDSIQTDSNSTQIGGRSNHPAVQGPAETVLMDTLHITATQNFASIKNHTDSSGKILVLLPAKTSNHPFAAVSITSQSAQAGDTLLLNNLHIVGFSNGIDIHVPVTIQAYNIVFENTTIPFRYLLKAGEKQGAVLFINTAKQ